MQHYNIAPLDQGYDKQAPKGVYQQQNEPIYLPPIQQLLPQEQSHGVVSNDIFMSKLVQSNKMEVKSPQPSEESTSDKKRKRFDLFFDVKQYHPPTKELKQDEETPKNFGPWTNAEDELLLKGMAKYGTQWTRIGKEYVLTRSRSSIAQRGRCLYQTKQKRVQDVVQDKNGPIVWHME